MATTEGTKISTPVGRIVWGNPSEQRARTDQNGKPIIKADGTPAKQYIFGFAISKQEFLATLWPAMSAEAAKGYPQGAPQNFAWKYDDGDDTRPVNGGGTPYAQREGYPGNYVITVASALDNPPPLFRFNPQTGGYDQMAPGQIKTGDYVSLALNIACNVPEQRTHTPSLYINPEGVEFVGYGTEIKSASAINPMQAFGGRQHQLPAGASSTPVSSAPAGMGMPMPGAPMGGAPQGYPQPGQMPQQPAPMQQPMQPAPMQGYPAPATDFVQPPQPGGYPQPMQPAPGQPMPGAPQGYPQPGMPGMMPPR